jgi:hypothetical protein
MTTNDPPEGRGEGRHSSRRRQHEPEVAVCPLHDAAARSSGENVRSALSIGIRVSFTFAPRPLQ